MTQGNCTQKRANEQGENWRVFFDDPEQLRVLVENVVQELIEAEFEEHIGVRPYERSAERRDYRNGYKPRKLKTRVGELELSIPQARFEAFRSQVFRRYQRSERAFLLTLQEMVIQGVSTRKVQKITAELCGVTFSRSMVSQLMAELDGDIRAWQERPLVGRYPYLIVDAEYEKVRENHKVINEAAIIIEGIHESDRREILSVNIANSETETTWSEVFVDLKRRGLSGVQLVVSDSHEGLQDAIRRHFQGSLWQRCQSHYIRNVLGKVRKVARPKVKALLDDIYQAPDLDRARERLGIAVKQLADCAPELSEFMEETCEETLSIYHFPPHHRHRLRTTNSLERLNEEVRRRTRVVRIFPNRESCLRLIASICMEKSEEWETGHRYLSMETLGKDDDYQQNSQDMKSYAPPAQLQTTSADLSSNPILQKI